MGGRLTPQEIHRFAFEGSTDAILVFDGSSGRILDANAATVELYQHSYEDLVELTVDDLCAAAEHEEDGLVPLLHRHRRRDGDAFPVDVSVGSLEVAGRPLSVMVVRDITERRRIEAELRRQRVKEALHAQDRVASLGRLAAGMAHEINNPLTYIIGNSAMVVEDLKAIAGGAAVRPLPDLVHGLEDVHAGATRIQRIVRDLMTFSRADPVAIGDIDVAEVLDAMIRLARAEYRGRARVVRDYATTPPVAANEPQLGQVILHLLVNAAQAIPEGDEEHNEIRVRTRAAASEVVVEIEDTGAGMSAEHLEHIFDPFFSSKGLAVASGLGLSVCQAIVTRLGGTIEVESAEGEGTAFRLALPTA